MFHNTTTGCQWGWSRGRRWSLLQFRCVQAATPTTRETMKGWRHQHGRKQLRSAQNETTSLQLLMHTNPLGNGTVLHHARDWIFPSSHGMRGKGNLQLPTKSCSPEESSDESLLPEPITPLQHVGRYRNSPATAKSTEEMNSFPPPGLVPIERATCTVDPMPMGLLGFLP